MVSIVVIYVKFSIQRCLNYLSSMHSLSAAVKGSWLFLNRFLCSTPTESYGGFEPGGVSDVAILARSKCKTPKCILL